MLKLLISLSFAFYVGEGDKRFQTLPSSVSGYQLGNIHYLDASKKVLRGASPEKNILELKRAGIKRVLIVKKQKTDEIDKEIQALLKNGYTKKDILYIPLPWRGITDFKKQCKNIIQALLFLKSSQEKTFLHCTVGEDRTGLVSGLYQIHVNHMAPMNAFQNEMCARGYAHANKSKPDWVADAVHDNLTVLFSFLANQKNLNESICENLNKEEVINSSTYKKFRCNRGSIDVVKEKS